MSGYSGKFVVRDTALPLGLIDIKVCAVNPPRRRKT